jgi:hypothetical protein
MTKLTAEALSNNKETQTEASAATAAWKKPAHWVNFDNSATTEVDNTHVGPRGPTLCNCSLPPHCTKSMLNI